MNETPICVGCGATAPDTDTNHTLISATFGWRLTRRRSFDGTSLLDHTVLAYGSNIRTVHYLDNCPTILAGGAARLKLGQHLVLPRDTPLCNAWLTLLNGLDIEAQRHGDSSGVVKELQA